MKRIDLLINEAREATQTAEFTAETGVQDSRFLRAFNDAQDRIQSLILNEYPSMFQKETVKTATVNSPFIAMPTDLFMDSRIELVEYSPTGQDNDYYKLTERRSDERVNGSSGNPSSYIRQSRRLILMTKPAQAGSVRITHQKAFPRLDKRRGRVSAVTLDNSARTITSLTLDTTVLTTDDVSFLTQEEYITVVSRDGTIKMKGIPITEVNGSTGVVTVDTFVFEDGETIAIGDYVVAGKYATTHSELPDICERYLLKFSEWRVLKGDSSSDSVEENTELKEMEGDIVASYARASNDVQGIPILDGSYLDQF